MVKIITVSMFLLCNQYAKASPLFEESDDQPLIVTIETDLIKIQNNKSEFHTSTENHLTGRFLFRDDAFNIKIQTRGHDRLARCQSPPLKISFAKSEIRNSLMKGNQKLKVVTHCQNDNLNSLFREHLIYKIYNLITDHSFQVRLLKIQYIDVNGKEDPIDAYAFFIESTKSIEKRLNLHELESGDKFNMRTYSDLSENWLNPSLVATHDAFQHLIRNNDWVIFYSEPTRTYSLANVSFFYNVNEGFPFPYDFDLAGVITWDDESYAYRYGNEMLCTNVEMRKAFVQILSHRDEYFQLIDSDSDLNVDYKNQFADYVNQFKSVEDFCLEAE